MASSNNDLLMKLGKYAGAIITIGILYFTINSSFVTKSEVNLIEEKARTARDVIKESTNKSIAKIDKTLGRIEESQKWIKDELTKQSRKIDRLSYKIRNSNHEE